MINPIRMAAVALLALAGLSLGACANEYSGVSPGYFARSGTEFSAATVTFQDHVVSPVCDLFVKETTPGKWVTIGAHAWNSGLVSGLSGGIATGANEQVLANGLGQHLVPKAIPALTESGAVFYAITGAANGGLNGYETYNARKFGNTQVCLKSAAGGIWSVPPSLAKAIKDGTLSQHQLDKILVNNKMVNKDGSVTFPMADNWGDSIAPAAR